jgi:hypothetical protein
MNDLVSEYQQYQVRRVAMCARTRPRARAALPPRAIFFSQPPARPQDATAEEEEGDYAEAA